MRARGMLRLAVCSALLAGLLGGLTCRAGDGQEASAPASDFGLASATAQGGAAKAVEMKSLPLKDVIRSGGWPMYVLALMSVLAVALVIYLLIVLRGSEAAPMMLLRDLVDSLKAGRLEEAQDLCVTQPCALSRVALAGILYTMKMPKSDGAMLKDVLEGEGARQADSIQGQTQYLLDIAVIAPMVGLLGTVLGMLRAFGAVAADIGLAKPVYLAGGVSQALVTTIFGLFVAIPTMCCYAYFRRRASNLVSQLESASIELLTALLGRKG